MNRGIRVLQTHALPLGYVAIWTKEAHSASLMRDTSVSHVERATRLELATSTLARWRSTR